MGVGISVGTVGASGRWLIGFRPGTFGYPRPRRDSPVGGLSLRRSCLIWLGGCGSVDGVESRPESRRLNLV